MGADRLLTMADNPRNVAGIYNYCDRWCERCLFTDRCFQYQTQEPFPETASEQEAMRLTLDHVRKDFETAFELIAHKMEELGIPLPSDEELAAPDPDEEAREERVRNHPLVRAGHEYGDLVDEWFRVERAALLAHADHLMVRADGDEDGNGLLMEAAQVKHALEIINHDRWFITPKISRALHGREWEAQDPDPERDLLQTDSNGSAKVALISIDRSEAAWRILAQWLDGSSTAVLMADTLAQLRAGIEAEFPDARRFVRPGFDETPS